MSDPDSSPVEWDADGAPRSRRFGDIYFSSTDGLAESRAVFLQGCGLPEAWAGRRRFTVGELGFGTGLNVLALLELWRRTRPDAGRLHVFSVEAFPLAAEEARRALSAWPELADLSALLTARWPRRARGLHRIDLPELDAVLDLAVMEAGEALEGWDGRADAWFLDGFAPSANPGMWREELLALVARRSAPGASAATFTVAGAVRRGLQAAGFEVAKRPGFGNKRERLEARLPGAAPDDRPAPRVCILGAGIAGAALARAFRSLGVEPRVIDAQGPGAGASGNPSALVMPRLDAGGGPPARLYAQAFHRAVDLFAGIDGAVISRGALQLEASDRDAGRFDAVAQSELFEPRALERVGADEASIRLGEDSTLGALWEAEALVVEPRAVLDAWLGEVEVARISRIERAPEGWRLFCGERLQGEADILCLAAGPAISLLAGGPALEPIRGQASFLASREQPTACAWGGYLIPTRDGLLFGATHDRGEDDGELRPADHRRNLQTLAQARPLLAQSLSVEMLSGRASVRAAARDRLAIAGEAAGRPGLYLLGGLGGRGFCLAPLLGEHVAAKALGLASPLPHDLAGVVNPARRALVKGL
jgi:tRNA 5-methylaminomethyl-2-thiouridine biosynthesis bifunctional protein